jgi:hypothetical protein
LPAWLRETATGKTEGELLGLPDGYDGQQVQVRAVGAKVLIAQEYAGATPMLVDLATGKVIWRSEAGRFATWYPVTGTD